MAKALSLLVVLSLMSASLTSTALGKQEPARQDVSTKNKTELTNQDVLEMIKSGLSQEIIVEKIKNSRSHFDTSPSTLADLKSNGVSEAVILAMVKASADPPMDTAPSSLDVKVPDGTEIEIQLKNTLSGQEAKVGDIVDFTVVRAIVVDGVTVFDRDASARARVTTAKSSGHWGKAGKLEWAMQDVQAIDGNRIPARFTKRELGDSKGGTVAVAAVATTVLLGPLGLLWGLKKGKAAIIPAGNRYNVFVHGDIVIKGKPADSSSRIP